MLRLASVLLALAAPAAVAAQVSAPAPADTSRDSVAVTAPAASYVPHRVYDVRAGRFTDFESLALDVSRADVAVVGERHDDPGTHRLQLALLEGLARRGRAVALSLEMFERDVQPALDAWLAGRVDEHAMLERARPWGSYATDYRPLVALARAERWPVIAANAPRPVAARVAREGLAALDALPPAERAWVAGELRCPRDDAYHAKFAAEMRGHGAPTGHSAGDSATVERLYEAQCVKDETMAESVAEAARMLAGRGTVVHVTGAFHADERLGAVERTARRLPDARIVVISAIPVRDLDAPDVAAYASRGDYLLFTLAPEATPVR